MKITTELMLSVQGNAFSTKLITFAMLPVVSGEKPGGTCSCYFDVSPAKTGPVRGVMQIPCLNLKSFCVKVLKGPHIIVGS